MSEQKKISIIVVARNEIQTIANTLNNIISQDFKDFDLIVIDGNSTDGTTAVIKRFERHISSFICEEDRNLYEAMNKGINISKSEWILFMNSGDLFFDKKTLSYLNKQINRVEGESVIIGNSIIKYPNYNIVISSNKNPLQFVHQATLYKKKLHEIFGMYLVDNSITISDYIFFNQIPKQEIKIIDRIISINSAGGVSSKSDSLFQKIFYDFLMQKVSKAELIIILIFYPFYKVSKNLILNLKSLITKT